ncbi:adenosine deaminase, partial [Myxococcota bacterium]
SSVADKTLSPVDAFDVNPAPFHRVQDRNKISPEISPAQSSAANLFSLHLSELRRATSTDLFRHLDEAIEWMQLAPLSFLDSARVDAFCRHIPKVDLHRHLEGSLRPQTLLDVAERHGISLPTRDLEELRKLVQVTPEDRTLLDFLSKFGTIGPVFKSRQVIGELTRETIVDAARDNVTHVELRFSPWYMAEAHGLDLEEVIHGVLQGVREASQCCTTSTRLILVVERQMPLGRAEVVERLAEKYADCGVVAIDLANDEHNYAPGPFAQVFRRAKKAGLAITVHAGEAGGAENVATSIHELRADRIGHGVRTCEDPSVQELVRTSGTTLELCPTSNVQTGAVEGLESHPLKTYLDVGLKVTVNTDDPEISGITLSGEYSTVIKQFGLSVAEVSQLVTNGVDGAFLAEGERSVVRGRVAHGLAGALTQLADSLTLAELRELAIAGIAKSGFAPDVQQRLIKRIDERINVLVGQLQQATFSNGVGGGVLPW